MIWALLFLVIGGYLCLDGLAGSMADAPVQGYGKEFIWGLGFIALAIVAFVIRIWTWLH